MNAKVVHVEVEAGNREREYFRERLGFARSFGSAAQASGLHLKGEISAILPASMLPADIKNIAHGSPEIDWEAVKAILFGLIVQFLRADSCNYVVIPEILGQATDPRPVRPDSKYYVLGENLFHLLGHEDGLDVNEVSDAYHFSSNQLAEFCFFVNLPNGYQTIPGDQWAQTILQNTRMVTCGAYDMDSFIILRL